MTFSNRAIGIAILLVTMAALVVIAGRTPAMAESPSACDVTHVVARALPAVVNITAVKVITGNGEGNGPAVDADSMVAAGNSAPAPAATEPAGPHFETFVGSGAIISPAGIIVTNKHVIQDAAVIKVTFSNHTQVAAQLIAAASLIDLAVLKVNVPEPLPTLAFGNSDSLQVGQSVIAVGNPLNLGTSVSVGVVSARGRDLMRSPFDDYIQTDASINPGNSGGPLLDCAGRIVGIDTALLSNSKVLGSIGLGFALSSNVAQFVADRLVNPGNGYAPNWVGFHLQNMTARLATIFGRPDMSGAIVTGVTPGSPAADAGIQAGDVIAGADGQELDNASGIMRYVVTRPVAQPISFLDWRDEQMSDVVVVGRPWPDMMALRANVLASPADVAQAQASGLGLHLGAKTDAAAKGASASGVLIDAVTPESQAEGMGLQPGDVIERVNGQRAATPAYVMQQLTRGSSADGDLVALLVRGKSGTRWVTLYVGRVYVAGLLAAPTLQGGFGPINDAVAGP
ncbi:MAG TPA: trypsin-like peptidase domain-containing protein [Acetobacteraceae bacterium]|nr:trypsin-like peptidase domain-containing protein [Acetobacteraceae bacterium]